jgi:Zn-dependent protease with chaperone function
MRLFLASLFTLLLLSSFLIAIFLTFLYFTGFFDIYLLFGFTILFNFIFWLFGPKISDWIYKFFYKVRWITIKELKEICPKSANFILETCNKYNFKVPKLGIIPDKNPNAFTYGSGRWNGRIIVTEGIFKYLDENERTSVYAHELGHIKNRDFIVMTIATVLLQLLYEMYVVGRLSLIRGGRRKSSGALLFVMLASYIFYWIGQYIVLYLSRIREFYADEFAAKETDPNYLASALIKISYGILANPDNVRLVNSTKYIGITNFNLSKNIGLIYYNCKNIKDFKPLAKALLYDIKNPWAFISELRSTHPLTGKRIRRLCSLSAEPLFDFKQIERENPVDKRKLYRNFLKDILVLTLPFLLAVSYPILYFLLVYFNYLPFSLYFIPEWLFLIGFGILVSTIYKYPGKKAQETTIIELMSDIYASPVRGKPVALEGIIVGRGVPGLIFSEDLMIQDKTGLIYLNYESWLPFLGNLIFGLAKVPKLIDKRAKIYGWFLRGNYQWIGLRLLETDKEKIHGFVKLGGLIGGIFFILLSVIIFLLI